MRGVKRWLVVLVASAVVAACQPVGSASPAGPASAAPTGVSGGSAALPSAHPAGSAAAELIVAVVGDSIPYGREDCGGCSTFVALLAARFGDATGMSAQAVNLSSHDNLTGARLVERLRDAPNYREPLSEADVIVVAIGHNDTPWNATDDDCDGDAAVLDWASYTGACVTDLATRHGAELDEILVEIKALRGGKPTAIRVLADYNDVIGFDQAPPEAVEPSVEVLDAFFAATCAAATRNDVACIDVYHTFNGPDGRAAAGNLLAGDYTHPSAAGHERIAELLFDARLRELGLSN
jgi:lysophospholipase L1-like esterase